jgi:hypothetical protein
MIFAPDYWEYLDKGRRSGGMPPIKDIVDWLNRKPSVKAKFGLTKSGLKGKGVATLGDVSAPVPVLSAAFGIAKNISKHGTKATNFFSDIVTPEYVKEFEKEIAQILGKTVAVNIIVGLESQD